MAHARPWVARCHRAQSTILACEQDTTIGHVHQATLRIRAPLARDTAASEARAIARARSSSGAELTARVREALQSLSPALRMPVILYDIEGLSYGEIAKVLGIAEGTVKSRIHRARQALREELKSLLGDNPTAEGV